MNLKNPPLPCPRCGAPAQVLEDSEEPLLACTVCAWKQQPIPAPSRSVDSGAFLAWLALGLLPIATPFVLEGGRVNDPVLGMIILVGSAACCLVAGFGLASLTSAGTFTKLVSGLMAGVALAFVCLVVGVFGACATGVIRFKV